MSAYTMSILQETYGKRAAALRRSTIHSRAGPVSSISEGARRCGKCSISENSGFNARAAAPIAAGGAVVGTRPCAVRVRVIGRKEVGLKEASSGRSLRATISPKFSSVPPKIDRRQLTIDRHRS